MALKRRSESSFVLFDVIYVDGTRSSNRKVPSVALGGLDGDAPAQALIEEQDREIARASGRPRPDIRSVVRSAARPTGEETPRHAPGSRHLQNGSGKRQR
jgi:hypothetical protein